MSPLLILALFLPLQIQPTDKCSLSGTVVDSVTGDPLNKVDLRLEPLDRQAMHVAVTKSDAEGHFALVDLDSGSYRLIGKRNGYLEMSYGTRKPHSEGSLVRLEKGQSLNGLTFKLPPSAVIAGAVRDSDGEPLEGAHVILARFTYAYGRPALEGFDSTDTDDRGEYRFRGLAAGKYYIGVEPNSHGWDQVDHTAKAGPIEIGVPTLYPGVTDMALAAPIEVSTGKRVTGMDLALVRSRVFRVSGRVVNGPAAGRMTVVLSDPENAGMRDNLLRTSTRNAAGDFEFRDVPPGSYVLTVEDQSLRGRTSVVAV
jgi:Carboxypeptidase regulatory-like domain